MEGRLFSGRGSRLDAFSGYPLRRGCPALPTRTTGTPEAAPPRSSRTEGSFPSGGPRPPRVEPDLSHDGLNPAHVPLSWAGSPTLGGCCTPRMGRADIDVANRGVDGSSHPRRPCYPRGNFSVMPGPHRWGHERSLGRGFPAGPLVFKGPVRPAFALALYGGFLTRLSRPLGARVTFSRACRPSRTAHPALSPRLTRGLGSQVAVGGVSLAPP